MVNFRYKKQYRLFQRIYLLKIRCKIINIIKSNKIFCVIAICCLLFSFQTIEVMTAWW